MSFFVWIAGLAGAALLFATGRMWLAFAQASERLSAHLTDLSLKIEEHTHRLEEVRGRSAQVKEEAGTLTAECNELEQGLRGLNDELTELKGRLERLRPAERQVPRDDRGDWKWKE